MVLGDGGLELGSMPGANEVDQASAEALWD